MTSVVGRQDNLYDQNLTELFDFAVETAKSGTLTDTTMYKSLGSMASFYTYCKYMYPVVALNQCLYARNPIPTARYHEKHLASSFADSTITPEFRFFFDWLDSQNIFNNYGRVVLFINEAGVESTLHRDYANPKSHKNEFIWISLDGAKKFYVYDSETKQKHFFSSPIVYFDNANWHGSESSQFASFSIRVDGEFSNTFLEKTGMYAHFRG